jgi:hypothetical protein
MEIMTDEARAQVLLRLFEDAGPEGMSEEEAVHLASWLEEAMLNRSLLGLWEEGKIKVRWNGGEVMFSAVPE